ncbi:MAG: ribonuclease Z [Bacteroidales bacterium]|nr:ribonuclease Z [Bacteroidales bacterium]
MSFSVRVLGSSSALPTVKRMTSAQAVLYNGTPYLIDCGEGTQIRMREYSLSFGRLRNIFISHIHGDHIFGLFGLLSTFSMLGRRTEMNIYCPEKLEQICNSLFASLEHNLGFKVNYIYLNPNGINHIHSDKNLDVFSFPLVHTKPTWGFLFRETEKERNIRKNFIEEYNLSIAQIVKLKRGGDVELDDGSVLKSDDATILPPVPKSFVYCSDTLPLKRLGDFAENVDLLYHEATFMDKDAELAKLTCHTTTIQAAELAKGISAKRLVLGHFSTRYPASELMAEARTFFPDAIEARDGLEIEI